MSDIVVLIISWSLSMLLFNFLFNKLNYKYDLFKGIQSKVNNLDEKRKGNLRLISFILIFPIYEIMIRMGLSNIIQGLVLGLLFSFRDIFLKKNLDTQI